MEVFECLSSQALDRDWEAKRCRHWQQSYESATECAFLRMCGGEVLLCLCKQRGQPDLNDSVQRQSGYMNQTITNNN